MTETQKAFLDVVDFVEEHGGSLSGEQRDYLFTLVGRVVFFTTVDAVQRVRIEELERRLAEMEAMYDKVAADLIEALDVASAYRATASTLHQEVERRNGVERRVKIEPQIGYDRIVRTTNDTGRQGVERRKSWPR
jgi:hypothetical protein